MPGAADTLVQQLDTPSSRWFIILGGFELLEMTKYDILFCAISFATARLLFLLKFS